MFSRLLGVFLLLFACASHADLRLRLDEKGLDAAQIQASQALIDEAFAKLPPRFIQALDRQVTVHWSHDLPDNGYGRITRLDALSLNARLLHGLVDGSAAHERTGRPHGTVRAELLATVLHELTHLYDRARLWSPEERARLQRCRREAQSHGLVGQRDACRGDVQRRFTLSDDPRLLDLAGWQQAVGQRGAREGRNGMVARSADGYELSNPREFVAVNMEYFLLDPEYACRRPSLQRYFSGHFGWAPARAQACPAEFAYLNASSDYQKAPLGKLDPARVYEVDYLFAEANDNWVSRWGHSMLRLVVCAPGRPRGPACRLDLDQHLVLSFRAFVGDIQLSSWDGLTGVYPSRLFILPLAQVIDEYTKVELRSLASIPLRLPREQQDALVRRAAELHWSYDGNYYFLSNNCAVETLKLLRSGTGRAELEGLDSIMPNGLLDSLAGRGLADRSVLADPKEALRLGYRFDSFRDRYQAMFAVIKQRLAVPQAKVDDWLRQPAAQRRPWLQRADLQASAALLLLEQAAFRQQLLLAQDELKQRYMGADAASDPTLNKAGDTIGRMLLNSGFLSRPAELLEGGYGLPQPSEWARLEQQTADRQQTLRNLSDDLDKDLRELLLPERRRELEDSEANLKQVGEHLRALHQQAGGLKLP
ncbi:DUF4105 domain-containing protein [Pseudomonas kuykendallii]|uniref:Uncharacterized protein n=1 Tax=Pseudomonas kuykendallii TaxID=1007099 RepID=A0A1H2SJ56_9PSED|nr:DUF4105 domain-containing protein [Pseudomonas kuykendallii]MCQ4270546.1 DUF4105 domain-containing protein [Pseudomonas kuykendallii]SDW31671.1 protein of unknown function [Pseudomonas kuykendallii]